MILLNILTGLFINSIYEKILLNILTGLFIDSIELHICLTYQSDIEYLKVIKVHVSNMYGH